MFGNNELSKIYNHSEIAYFRNRNTNMVVAMAISETNTPIYPTICKVNACWGVKVGGRALSKMAKLVRWLHSQTVMEDVERPSLTPHPSSDHSPSKRIASARSL